VAAGAEIIWIPQIAGHELDLTVLLDELARRGILYLLVEGGSQVLASFVRHRLFDEIVTVTAPLLLGGDGVPSIAALGTARIADGIELTLRKSKFIGRDLALWLRSKN
jgi:diaminohydroxyphosphoribosylaminopyrimidine deaminase/5-amino-6-(5-phosphoribosylamino)uracil reductase